MRQDRTSGWAVTAALLSATMLLPGTALAGGIGGGAGGLNWASSVSTVATEGASAGQAATVIGCVLFGVSIAMSLGSTIPMVVNWCLGMAFAGASVAIAGLLFGGAGGGGLDDVVGWASASVTDPLGDALLGALTGVACGITHMVTANLRRRLLPVGA